MRKTLSAVLLLGAFAYSAPALAQCTVPNVLTNGQIADASEVMDNFNAVADCVDATTNAAVTTTGTPTTGAIAVFSGPKVVTDGNLTGDVTTSGGTAATLADTGVAPGTYVYPTITVDSKGRLLAAESGSVAGGGGTVTYWGHGQSGVPGFTQVTATLTSGTSVNSPSEGLWPYPRSAWFFANHQTSAVLTFDFGTPVVISGIAFIQNAASSQGTWQTSYSDDGGVTYTNIGSPGTWGGALRSSITFANSVPHRHWRLTQTGGTTSHTPWQNMFMFRWGPSS